MIILEIKGQEGRIIKNDLDGEKYRNNYAINNNTIIRYYYDGEIVLERKNLVPKLIDICLIQNCFVKILKDKF